MINIKILRQIIIFSFFIVALALGVSPFSTKASQICSLKGYTILTVNGVFASEADALNNTINLMKKYILVNNQSSGSLSFNSEPLTIDYLYNPSHLGGLRDVFDAMEQGIFDSEAIIDYDLVNMLQSASQKITTQKVLLVGHSQGNFYANSFYDVVSNKEWGIPSQSLAIYSVATPSSRVAGGGKYITSDTDKVIARFVSRVQFLRKVLPPNAHIEIHKDDNSLGHSFVDIYLKYQAERIVSEIQSTLGQLKTNNLQKPDKSCLIPPPPSLSHSVQGTLYTVADPVFEKAVSNSQKIIAKTIQTIDIVGDKIKEATAAIGNFFSKIFNSPRDNFNLAQVFDLSQNQNQNNQNQQNQNQSNNNQPKINQTQSKDQEQSFSARKPQIEKTENNNNQEDQPDNQNQKKKNKEQEIAESSKKNLASCSINSSQAPLHQKVIINEIAWMGTANSANDEWIELKNISGQALNLDGYQLIDKNEQIKIVFGSNDKISSNGFYLLERTDDNSVPNISADKIYTGALSDTNEALRLFDNQCNLIDEVLANPDWPAGDKSSKRTMERKNDLSWQSSAQPGGTPKASNSSGYLAYSSLSQKPTTDINQQTSIIKITEIMYDLAGSDSGREWIEIYNAGSSTVSLEGWKFYENNTNHNLSLVQGSINLEPGNYAIIADDANKFLKDWPQYIGPLFISSFSLSNSGETIAIKNGDIIIDEVSYDSSQGANGDGKSLQLINDRWQPAMPTPGATNQISENQAPRAFFSYKPLNPKVEDLINFDASSSTDPDGNITSYFWDFGDSSTSSSVIASASHSYLSSGNYLVSLTVFDNQNAPSFTTSTIISVVSKGVNHILISEILFDAEGNDEGKEFIELYNPSSSDIDLSGWSLRILKDGESSSSLLAKFGEKKEDITFIKSKSFLLIGLNNYNSVNVPADIVRSSSLPNSASTIYLIDKNGNEIDSLNYAKIFGNLEIAEGQSLERKAFDNGFCISAQNEGEFLGNGCDTNSDDNFQIRAMPKPQNSSSLTEPRLKPQTVKDFDIKYSSSTKALIFTWQPSQDYSGASSSLIYKITDISNTSTTLKTIETASTTAEISTNQRGVSYIFSIQAFDKDGLGSEKTEAQIEVPPLKQTILAQQLDDSVESDEDYWGDPFVQKLSFKPEEFQGSFNRIELKVFSKDGWTFGHSLWIREIDPDEAENNPNSTFLYYTNDADLGLRDQWNTIVYNVYDMTTNSDRITTKPNKIYEFAIRGRYSGIAPVASNLRVKGSSNQDSYPYGYAYHKYGKTDKVRDLYFKIYLEE